MVMEDKVVMMRMKRIKRMKKVKKVSGTAGPPQELEFGARSALKF